MGNGVLAATPLVSPPSHKDTETTTSLWHCWRFCSRCCCGEPLSAATESGHPTPAVAASGRAGGSGPVTPPVPAGQSATRLAMPATGGFQDGRDEPEAGTARTDEDQSPRQAHRSSQ